MLSCQPLKERGGGGGTDRVKRGEICMYNMHMQPMRVAPSPQHRTAILHCRLDSRETHLETVQLPLHLLQDLAPGRSGEESMCIAALDAKHLDGSLGQAGRED